MKIKKVDDKPMVIHTKKIAKLHTHEPKKAAIKASNIYTVDRSPKIKGSKIATTENKKFRRSTIHPVDNAKKGMFRQYRAALKESKQSIKTKNSSIKVAGAAGAQTALSQMEGGEEVRDAANIAYVATRPVTGTASRGAELFRRKALAEKRKRIKKVEAGKKLAKKTAKETAKIAAKEASKETAKAAAKEGAKVAAKVGTTVAGTAAGAETGPYAPLIGIAVGKAVGDKIDKMDAQRNSRNRKIKFFLDKMKAEGEQQDSFAKLVKDLFVNKMALSIKKIMVAVGGFLLVLVLLIAVTVLPVSYESEANKERDTVDTQIAYIREFVQEQDDMVEAQVYADISVTGTTFERPEFDQMIQDIRAGKINTVIPRDLSRLGRNYVEAGNYIERVFPFLDVRYIAITDDFDTARPGTDLSVPLKNIVNEYYSKDLSKKVETGKHSIWAQGSFSEGTPPYGYYRAIRKNMKAE